MKKSNNFSDGEDYDKVCNIYTFFHRISNYKNILHQPPIIPCGYRCKKNIELGNPTIFSPSKVKRNNLTRTYTMMTISLHVFLNVEELKF